MSDGRLTVRCLTTGHVRGKRRARGIRRYLPGDWADEVLPVHAFLVEHPEGRLLFDTGQTAAAASPGHLPRWHPFLRLARFELTAGDEVAAQLARLGIAPGDVRWVVLSHLHTDHVGGVGDVPGAEVLVSRTEWERARGIGGRLRGYVPQHWPAGREVRTVEFADAPLGPFAASAPLTADGRLVLVPTPGHTPGHISLLVRGDGDSYLLGGDMAHSAGELERVAPAVAGYCRRTGTVYLGAHDARARELLERP